MDTTFQLAEYADINRVSADQPNLFKIVHAWKILQILPCPSRPFSIGP
ncbi:MAG: hypothetical protein ABI618_19345 [Nitrospirota bacterium]